MVVLSPSFLPIRPRPIGDVVEILPVVTSLSSLVTSEESDVTTGKISTTSPIGRGLMGKKEGDTTTIVTPSGKRELEILKLRTVHDLEEESPATDGAAGD